MKASVRHASVFAASVLTVSLFAGSAQASYVTSFDTDVSGDFGYAQIGQLGRTDVHAHAFATYEDGYLSLIGRYAVTTSQILLSGGSTGTYNSVQYDGLFNDTYARMTFTYFGDAPQTTSVGMGVRLPKTTGPNNYGYVARLNGTNSNGDVLFELIEWNNYNDFTVVDNYLFTGENTLSAGETEYQLDLSAVNDGLGNALITATLYSDGNVLGTLQYTDATPKAAGWVGMFAGQVAVNNSTLQGVHVTGFSVGSNGFITIPEPTSLRIVALAGTALLGRRRR